MFMDRQELKYSLKLIKGDFKQRSFQCLYGLIFLAVFSIFNVLTSSLFIMLDKSKYQGITSIQDFSGTALFAIVIFPLILYIFTYKKTMMSNIIFPQTNNTRFVKDVVIGVIFILALILAYIFSYFFSFGAGYLLSILKENTAVITEINLMHVSIASFSLLMYGLLILSICMLIGTVIKKIKLFSLIFPVVLIYFISTRFFKTISIIVYLASVYVKEGSMLVFAGKILVTVLVLLALAYIINNKTDVENTVNYKSSKNLMIACVCTALLFLIGFISTNNIDVYDIFGSFTEVETSNIDDEFANIEIDVSGIEKGTEIKLVDNFSNDDLGYYMEVNYAEPLIVTGDTMLIYYRFMPTDNASINIQDYTKESFEAHLEGETLYLNYEINGSTRLINISSSFLVNQFDIVKEKVNTSNYLYLGSASAMIEFE